jgi:hypothetical protein
MHTFQSVAVGCTFVLHLAQHIVRLEEAAKEEEEEEEKEVRIEVV